MYFCTKILELWFVLEVNSYIYGIHLKVSIRFRVIVGIKEISTVEIRNGGNAPYGIDKIMWVLIVLIVWSCYKSLESLQTE